MDNIFYMIFTIVLKYCMDIKKKIISPIVFMYTITIIFSLSAL